MKVQVSTKWWKKNCSQGLPHCSEHNQSHRSTEAAAGCIHWQPRSSRCHPGPQRGFDTNILNCQLRARMELVVMLETRGISVIRRETLLCWATLMTRLKISKQQKTSQEKLGAATGGTQSIISWRYHSADLKRSHVHLLPQPTEFTPRKLHEPFDVSLDRLFKNQG